MSRFPGLGVASTAIAVMFLGAVVVIAALGLRSLGGPGDASPSPTLAGIAPTPTIEPTPTESPGATAQPSPPPISTPEPSGDVVAYTNPDGISPGGFAGDDYPFIAQAQTLPTYGILWVDPNQRDFHIGLTGDIEGAIEALKDGIPRGITVYFFIVEHTQAEICAIRDQIMDDIEELATRGIFVTGGGCGNKEMVANIYMSPVTSESIAFMRSRYGGPLDFEDGGDRPLRAFDPPVQHDVRLEAVLAGAEPELLTCGRRPFPREGLQAPRGAESADGPAADALRFALVVYDDLYADLLDLSWQLAESDEYGATFLASRGDSWLEVSVWAGVGKWAPGAMDDCDPRVLALSEQGNAAWRLDPDYAAPTSDSTELHVLVSETACTGSASPEGRILPPVVDYSDRAVQLAISIRGLGGMHTCPGNPSFPITVLLPQALGDRELEGASTRPY